MGTPLDALVTNSRGIIGHSYTLQYRANLSDGAWQKLTDVDTVSATANVQVSDPAGTGAATRFYRLVTPKLP